ncbi:MAG: sulfurtransferase TusA family protein [Candidatus Thiodiazotropha sp. (ex Monitilora ramsayi)]|nr:sulfurtransferase TusA family protein [Candidatus Thiodiazotropha sp. (ex Monitilora ramsayi)]
MSETVHTLDARGLNCPLPILRTRKAITALASGDILEVTATDPGSVKDLDSFCSQTGHEMVSSKQVEDGFFFRIRKA